MEVALIPLPEPADIRRLIETLEDQTDMGLASVFRNQASVDPTKNWKLLTQLFDFHFVPGDTLSPFHPMGVFHDGRTMIPTDLTDAQLDQLQGLLKTIEHPEFKARIADVLWLRRKDIAAARIAVENYFEFAKQIESPENWVQCMERYERAVRLARQIDRQGEIPKPILAYLESRVMHHGDGDVSFFTWKALDLLAEFCFGDFESLAGVANRGADRARTEMDFHKARHRLEVAAKLLKLAKKQDEAEASRVVLANTFVEEAEGHEARESFMVAHKFWEDAIKAFRDRPSLRSKIPELQKRLAVAGQKSKSEMKVVSHEVNIKEHVEETQRQFRGLTFDDALCRFAMHLAPLDPVALRDQTLKGLEHAPIHGLFDAAIMDEAGRKIAHRPSIATNDPVEKEIAIEGFMDEEARHMRHFTVHAFMAPAQHVILEEHEISEDVIRSRLENHLYIESDRLPFFVKAITMGFQWDFSTSLHIFVPQFEYFLRSLLESLGVIPRTMEANGVEVVWGIERILKSEEISTKLGAAHVYELQSLLAGRMGPNIRNCIAHGLLSEASLNGESAYYLWWLLYRLTIIPTSMMAAHSERLKIAKSKEP